MVPDGKNWDELPSLMKTAAAKLGYDKTTWDNHERPARSDVCWSFLTARQKRAANCMEVAELARELESLHDEITNGKMQLRKIRRGKVGTANGREVSVESHLEIDPDITRQRQNLKLGQKLHFVIKNCFLHEYNYTFPACMSLLVHCFLYSVLHGAISRVTYSACDAVISSFSDWHFINNHFDPTHLYATFLLLVILFSVILARLTGAIYDWNDNEKYQRCLDVQLRNRWRMGCWDVCILNWFSGDKIRNEYGVKRSEATDHIERNKWGPRTKALLDVLSFYACLTGVEFFGNNWINHLSNTKESILEGLPSRRLYQQWTERMGNENGGNSCNKSLSGDDDAAALCTNSTVSFMSDVLNWATNADRCGWVKHDEANEEVINSAHEKEKYVKGENGEFDTCNLKEYNEMCPVPNVTGTVPKKAHPWKQSKEEWRQQMNILDDAYLRATISVESYYLFVGDPHAHFINPKRKMIVEASLAGISFAGLSWFEIPFIAI
ncbi:hypothetical protein ACHAXA_005535 [Cyclostephanos tholiformis]|uniref:Uncharacterized protein n=1 Tax=Cyclostephanos tholiformis TaxID=382380 RepID=A0ABD3RFQ7_9STRA